MSKQFRDSFNKTHELTGKEETFEVTGNIDGTKNTITIDSGTTKDYNVAVNASSIGDGVVLKDSFTGTHEKDNVEQIINGSTVENVVMTGDGTIEGSIVNGLEMDESHVGESSIRTENELNNATVQTSDMYKSRADNTIVSGSTMKLSTAMYAKVEDSQMIDSAINDGLISGSRVSDTTVNMGVITNSDVKGLDIRGNEIEKVEINNFDRNVYDFENVPSPLDNVSLRGSIVIDIEDSENHEDTGYFDDSFTASRKEAQANGEKLVIETDDVIEINSYDELEKLVVAKFNEQEVDKGFNLDGIDSGKSKEL